MTDLADAIMTLAPVSAPVNRVAEVPVSAHAIAVWCASVGVDVAGFAPAAGSRQAAPLAMMQTWASPRTTRARQAAPTVHARVRALAAEHGLTHIVATNYELRQTDEVRVGDLVTEASWVEDVSDEKSTALGDGRFVTICFEVRERSGAARGTVRARTFYYRDRAAAARPGPARAADAVEPWERIERLPLSRTTVVTSALASQDHEPVHHDHEVARGQGLPDIITSIVSTAGFLTAYAERFWGSDRLDAISTRLRAPAFPGDVLELSGRDAAPEPGRARVPRRIEVQIAHDRGLHCLAEVTGSG